MRRSNEHRKMLEPFVKPTFTYTRKPDCFKQIATCLTLSCTTKTVPTFMFVFLPTRTLRVGVFFGDFYASKSLQQTLKLLCLGRSSIHAACLKSWAISLGVGDEAWRRVLLLVKKREEGKA